MKANVEILSFLIGSYNEMVNAFGETDKTNEFFLKQLYGLVNIHQVSMHDANIIKRVIGLDGPVDLFNFEISRKRINNFIDTMNIMEGLKTTESRENQLHDLYQMNKVLPKVASIIRDIYALPKIQNTVKKSSFGILRDKKSIMEDVPTDDLNKWNKFIHKYSGRGFYLSIKNPNAVCSCDTYIYRYSLDEYKRGCESAINKLQYIKKESDYFVSEVRGDGCSMVQVQETKVTDKLKSLNINFAKLVTQLKNQFAEREENNYDRD